MLRLSRPYKPLRLFLYLAVFFLSAQFLGFLQYFSNIYDPPIFAGRSNSEVLLFDHANLQKSSYFVKLENYKQRQETEVLLIGNHTTRTTYATKERDGIDVFNLTWGNVGLSSSLRLLEFLKANAKLPTRAVVLTFLTHGDLARGIDDNVEIRGSHSFSFHELVTLSSLFTQYKYALVGFAGLIGRDLWIDYERCRSIFLGSTPVDKGRLHALWSLVTRPLPAYVVLNLGLMSKDEVCQKSWFFHEIDFESFNSSMGFHAMHQTPVGLRLRAPYQYKRRSESETSKLVKAALARVDELLDFGKSNDLKIVFLFPPRFEKPLNSHLDEIANRVFERSRTALVADFRRHSMDRSLYYDDSHVGAGFSKLLLPCLKKVVSSPDGLVSMPAVEERGRTVC